MGLIGVLIRTGLHAGASATRLFGGGSRGDDDGAWAARALEVTETGTFEHGASVLQLLADRIGVVEGLLGDLRRGRVPNIFAELGWRAEWRHNRRDLLLRNLLRAGLVAGAVAWLRRRDS